MPRGAWIVLGIAFLLGGIGVWSGQEFSRDKVILHRVSADGRYALEVLERRSSFHNTRYLVQIVDQKGNPLPGKPYEEVLDFRLGLLPDVTWNGPTVIVNLPGASSLQGTLDGGFQRWEDLDPPRSR